MSEPYIPLLRIPGQQAKLATLNRHTEGRRFRGLQSYPSRGYSPTLPGATVLPFPGLFLASQSGPPGTCYTSIYVPSVYEWVGNPWPTPYMLSFSFIFLHSFPNRLCRFLEMNLENGSEPRSGSIRFTTEIFSG